MTTEESTGTATETGSTEQPEKQQDPRPVNELLNLKTYQGMSDAEIQSVIDWYVDQSRNDSEAKAYQAAIITEMNSTADAYAKAAAESNDILKQLLQKDLNLVTISGGESTQGGAE